MSVRPQMIVFRGGPKSQRLRSKGKANAPKNLYVFLLSISPLQYRSPHDALYFSRKQYEDWSEHDLLQASGSETMPRLILETKAQRWCYAGL